MRPSSAASSNTPQAIGAVAAPLVLELGERFEERFAVLRPDAVFDRDQDGPAIVLDRLAP